MAWAFGLAVLFWLVPSGLVFPDDSAPPATAWQTLQPGVEYAAVPLSHLSKKQSGSDTLHLVRIRPDRARLRVILASQKGDDPRPLQEWAKRENLVTAINLGMYQEDRRSHVGYLKHGPHLNSHKWNAYQGVFVMGPDSPSLPQAALLDLDDPTDKALVSRYATVAQNLRLVKNPGVSVWKGDLKGWSEAALAQDGEGRLLFCFVAKPLPMNDFISLLLHPSLDVKKVVHLDGGPPAGLSVHAKHVTLDLAGVPRVGLLPKALPVPQQAIPNVLGVVRELPKPPAPTLPQETPPSKETP